MDGTPFRPPTTASTTNTVRRSLIQAVAAQGDSGQACSPHSTLPRPRVLLCRITCAVHLVLHAAQTQALSHTSSASQFDQGRMCSQPTEKLKTGSNTCCRTRRPDTDDNTRGRRQKTAPQSKPLLPIIARRMGTSPRTNRGGQPDLVQGLNPRPTTKPQHTMQ